MRIYLIGLFCIFTIGHCPSFAAEEPWTVIPYDTYASFVRNWDTDRQPVFCALIRSPADWRATFSPAVVMQEKRPVAPPVEFFFRSDLLVVSRIDSPPVNLAAFDGNVHSIETQNGEMRVRYHYTWGKSKQRFQIKRTLTVAVPKLQEGVRSVVFTENGKDVCRVSR